MTVRKNNKRKLTDIIYLIKIGFDMKMGKMKISLSKVNNFILS